MTAPAQVGPSPSGGGPVPSLSANERTVLHRAARGHTYAVIARDLGLAEKSVSKIALRLNRKLGALNITHAVHLAHERRIVTERADCGDRAAYLRHLRRKEPACWRCLAANAAHEVEMRAARKTAMSNAA